MPQTVDARLAQMESAALRWALRGVVAIILTIGGALLNRGIDKLEGLTQAVQALAGDNILVKSQIVHHEEKLSDHELRIRNLERGKQ